MTLDNGDRLKVENKPEKAFYKKQENGLYELIFENYVVRTSSGKLRTVVLKIPNVRLLVDDDSGIISLDQFRIDFNLPDSNGDVLYQLIIPDEE